jgi:hypothetical protein
MAIVDDLIARGEKLDADRQGFERIWREVAAEVMPNGADFDAAAVGADGLARRRSAVRAGGV